VTFSVYLKEAEHAQAEMRVVDKTGATSYALCGMTNPVPTITTEQAITVGVENAALGWCRFYMTLNIGAGATTPTFALLLTDDDGDHTYDGDGSSGIYAWGAQVEEESDTVDYIPTTVAAVQIVASTPVTFNESFIDVFAITMSVLSEDMATAIYIFQDAPYPERFLVRVFDQAGDRIARTISWHARGV